jgi:mannose/fructose-specific phosphotransferase system component IIA
MAPANSGRNTGSTHGELTSEISDALRKVFGEYQETVAILSGSGQIDPVTQEISAS